MEYRNKFTPLQEAWLKALESGVYKQAQGYLAVNDGFCCLGLATYLVKPDHESLSPNRFSPNESIGQMPLSDIYSNYDFIEGNIEDLAEMNDGGSTFEEIARHIRANPERFFHNFR